MNNRWFGGVQNRERRFSFGARVHAFVGGFLGWLQREEVTLEPADRAGCFTANATQWDPSNGGRSRSCRTGAELRRGLVLQGLPENYLDDAPFTIEGAIRVVGNGVPMVMGRAVARSVRQALGFDVVGGQPGLAI